MTRTIKWMPKRDDATHDMIVSTRNIDDEHSVLEVWAFNERESKVHRQIELPSSPLCTTWLGLGEGNFFAVGTMDTSIQIWDLDDISADEPYRISGATDGHTDSVLGLAWNKKNSKLLASASADKQIKIWDLVTGKCVTTMNKHSDKVHVVAWNEFAPHLLLSGSSDRTVLLKDFRTPTTTGCRFSVTSHVESLSWHQNASLCCLVGLENGIVELYDIRQPSPTIFTLTAHDGAVTSISFNPGEIDTLATGSLDGTVKLWDVSNNIPTWVATKNPGVGGILSFSFIHVNPHRIYMGEETCSRIAIGGETGKLHIWDTRI